MKKNEILKEMGRLSEREITDMSKKEKNFNVRLLEHQATTKGEEEDYADAKYFGGNAQTLSRREIPKWAIKRSRNVVKGANTKLYKGVTMRKTPEEFINWLKKGIPMTSWTKNRKIAKRFASRFYHPPPSNQYGYVIESMIPKNKILIHYKAFPSMDKYLNEREVLVEDIRLNPSKTNITYFSSDKKEEKLPFAKRKKSMTDGLIWK